MEVAVPSSEDLLVCSHLRRGPLLALSVISSASQVTPPQAQRGEPRIEAVTPSERSVFCPPQEQDLSMLVRVLGGWRHRRGGLQWGP